MKRWNGWGEEAISHHFPPKAQAFIEQKIGPGRPSADATLEQVLQAVPASRLPEHPLVNRSPLERVKHARGQSLPDWIALRSGRIPAFPDGVAFPTTPAEVLTLLAYAQTHQIKILPYGGGTSVVGHISLEPDSPPVLVINLQRLNRLTSFEPTSHLATFGAGVLGPDLEAQLRARGFTLGHFPQSFEYSTLGGWVVTRSSGQQSRGYGRIEDLFAGGKLLTPAGELHMPCLPASAAGPDLRQLVLGSEGRLGILTEATVRVSPLPEVEQFHGLFFPSFTAGMMAVRQMVQAKLPLSMARLSNGRETETNLALAGHEFLIGSLEKILRLWGIGAEKCLMLVGFTGSKAVVKATQQAAFAIAKEHGGQNVGQQFGQTWAKGRFRTPYLRNTLWDVGYAIDTFETAMSWDTVADYMGEVEQKIAAGLTADNEPVHVFTHLSHMYPTGCSAYTTYVYRLAADPDQTLEQWQKLKALASETIVQYGGTISHQHGVGKDHKRYLSAEKGELGMATLQGVVQLFDPAGLFNTGNLW